MRPPMRLSAAAPVRAQAEQDAPVREPITSNQALRLCWQVLATPDAMIRAHLAEQVGEALRLTS